VAGGGVGGGSEDSGAMKCEYCGNPGATKRKCRTMYADDTKNVDPVLCDECATGYNEYWDEMWAEYYSGLL